MTAIKLNDDAIKFLLENIEDSSTASSPYWHRELQSAMPPTNLAEPRAVPTGNVSWKTGIIYSFAHWLLQTPWRRMGDRFPNYAQCEKLGRLVAARQHRQFTNDMIRQVLTLALLHTHVESLPEDEYICLIGDGYGVLSSLLSLIFPNNKIIMVNLAAPLGADMAYFSRVMQGGDIALAVDKDTMTSAIAQENIRCIAVHADQTELIRRAKIGLAANISSMQEMNLETINAYFKHLRNNKSPRTLFYCCNRLEKFLTDELVTRFFDYPWAATDQIIVDEICPWDNITYNSTVPFWHTVPHENRSQHRLVVLSKNDVID